ncbi:MAG TPA: hypothetical protein VE053_03100, partial [Allosphingosinicella sp.]|nr:hypothetical protein [Allosphingosinicella sp.]
MNETGRSKYFRPNSSTGKRRSSARGRVPGARLPMWPPTLSGSAGGRGPPRIFESANGIPFWIELGLPGGVFIVPLMFSRSGGVPSRRYQGIPMQRRGHYLLAG